MVLKTGGNVSRHLPKSLQFQCFTRQTVSPSQEMNRSNGSARKRPPPTPKESWPNKQQATTPTTPVIDDEFLDEDVFLDETLLPEDEESLILRDIEQRQDFASRLAKWARPPLSSGYVSQCQSISESLPCHYFFSLDCWGFKELLNILGGFFFFLI